MIKKRVFAMFSALARSVAAVPVASAQTINTRQVTAI